VLLLVLVAVTALSPLYVVSQDTSRLCLTRAVVHGHLYDDGCFGLDRARYKGHDYSDKAPGLSFIELPVAEALRLPEQLHPDGRLWIVRLFGVGTFFVAGAFLIGRIAEGLAPRFGGVTLVSFALGTLMAPFAAVNFDEVPSAVLGFAAFLLAWRRKPLLAGVVAGAAVAVEYQTAIVAVAVAVYVALTGWRALVRYVAGVLPSAALLGLYDWVAFGAPGRLSYRYVDNTYALAQQKGLFGINAPTRYGVFAVFSGNGGLLVTSPVLVAAAWGLVVLGRRYRAEAVLCAGVTIAFVILNIGYFLPYGGSPGPRFLIPALPFLALGLAPAFAQFPRSTGALAVVSVATTIAKMLNWEYFKPRRTVWAELARIPAHGSSSAYVEALVRTVFDWVLPGRVWGAGVVGVFAIAALVVAARTVSWRAQPGLRTFASVRAGFVVVSSAGLIVAANAFAASGYVIHDLSASVTANVAAVVPGQEVNFEIEVTNSSLYQGYADVELTIHLPPGMRLLGAPYFETGLGCKGASTIRCDIGDLSAHTSTPVKFGVQVSSPVGQETLRAVVNSGPYVSKRPATYTVAID
jgi:hypothetical protein